MCLIEPSRYDDVGENVDQHFFPLPCDVVNKSLKPNKDLDTMHTHTHFIEGKEKNYKSKKIE